LKTGVIPGQVGAGFLRDDRDPLRDVFAARFDIGDLRRAGYAARSDALRGGVGE